MRSILIGLVGLLTLGASPALAADAATLEANKKAVVEFYEKGLNQKDFEAASKFFGHRYVQHNPTAPDGLEGFKAFLGFLREKFPDSHSEIKHVFADGDYVILHVHACARKAAAAAPSSISSSSRMARSSSTGTWRRTFRRNPPTATACSSEQGGRRLAALSLLGHSAGCTSWRAGACGDHLGARNFLDLAGRARPSSTSTRWPNRKSTMSCSRETCIGCAITGVARTRQRKTHGQGGPAARRHIRDRQSAFPHLFSIFSPLGPTLIWRPSGCFLVW